MLQHADWIWLDDPEEESRTNRTVVFRREFDLPEGQAYGLVCDITADSRYRLFINGEWLGDGPARAYPEHYRFDRFELDGVVRPGRNVIEVMVQWFGVSTFHYIVSEPGLLLAVWRGTEPDASPLVVTDASWQARPGYEWEARTPRISCQQDFEEHLDLRRTEIGEFGPVNVVRSQADDPHRDLQLRDVRQLARRTASFRRVVDVQRVEPLKAMWSLRLREVLSPYPADANMYPYAGIFFTELRCLELAHIEWCWLGPVAGLFIDGQPVETRHDQGVTYAESRVLPGRHLVALPVAGPSHDADISLGWRNSGVITWAPPGREPGDDEVPLPPWFCIGPLWKPERATNCFMEVPGRTVPRPPAGASHLQSLPAEVREQILELARRRQWSEVVAASPTPPRRLTRADLSTTDAYLAVRGDAVVGPGTSVRLFAACLDENAECTIIEPPPEGGDVRLLLDLDDETIGWFACDLTAPGGTVLDAYFFEYRLERPDELPVDQHTGTNHNVFRLVCREGRNRVVSRKRRGARYAALVFRNLRGPVRVRNVRIIEATYPTERRGAFACSDARLERVWEISRRTLELCMEDVFTDCPLYEQTLWIGDARNEAVFNFYAFGAADIVRRCCTLGAQSLEHLPIVGCQVPSGWDVLLPAWSFLWEIMVWEMYLYTGDRDALEKLYPAAMRNVRNALTFCTDHGLFSGMAWNMFDWTGIDDGHNTVLHNSMFLVGALDAAARCADALGNPEDARFCRNARTELVAAINRWWDPARGAYPDSIHADGTPSERTSQHTSALALLYDIAPPEHREQGLRNVLDPPPGMTRVGSPFALYYFLEALEKERRFEDLLGIIRHFWGEMLDRNARTCWETVHFDSPGFPTRSHCHAWSSAPIACLSRILLGVSPVEPGFREARVAPVAVGGVTHASGTVPTPHGSIRVRWRIRENGEVEFSADAPEAVRLIPDTSGLTPAS